MSRRPRPKHKIACVDCGGEFMAKRPHAKRDPICRALKQALAVREFPIKCPGNHDQPHYFYRLDGYKRHCIGCCLSGIGKAPKPMAAACERCEEIGSAFYPDSPICIECIQRADQPHADEVTRWLLGQRQERLTNAPTTDATAAPAPPVVQAKDLPPACMQEREANAQALLAGNIGSVEYHARDAEILSRYAAVHA